VVDATGMIMMPGFVDSRHIESARDRMLLPAN